MWQASYGIFLSQAVTYGIPADGAAVMAHDEEISRGVPPDTLSAQVLKLFKEMGKDRLDLHVLFEAAGNKPEERERVLDAIEGLTREGLVEASGGDYYTITAKGKAWLSRG
jgi:coproporphyrinogen III oxidase-like Fe-S oxidoreductase